MAELDGSIVVVHGDPRARHVLGRVLATLGRGVIAIADLTGLGDALREGTPALLVIGTHLRLAPGCEALVEQALVEGCHGCIVVHPEREDVPAALFAAGAMSHLVTSAMPALAEELFVTAQKILRDERFGLDRYLGWAATTGETEIVATTDRVRAVAQLARTVEALQLGRRQAAAVMLATDELVLNAIHRAPIDHRSRRYLADLPHGAPHALHGRERPRLRWGCDGRWFAVSVRDAYGSLEPATVLRHVATSLSRRGRIRTEGPGAGIGLAMTYDAVTQLVFDLEPGHATEAIALIDVRPGPVAAMPQVASFHLFQPRSR